MGRLFERMGGYALVGIGTFLLDLGFLFVLRGIGVPDYFAIVLAFLTAVSVNFFLSYKFVFKGTEQTAGKGYLFFVGIAALGFIVIAPGSIFVSNALGINLYLAKTIVGGFMGGVNFSLNNFFNFKMGLR